MEQQEEAAGIFNIKYGNILGLNPFPSELYKSSKDLCAAFEGECNATITSFDA